MNKIKQPLEKIVLNLEILKVNNIVKYENTNPFNEDLKVQFRYVKIVEIIDENTIHCITLDTSCDIITNIEKISIIYTNSKHIEKIEEISGIKLSFIQIPIFGITKERGFTAGYIYSNSGFNFYNEFVDEKNEKIFEKYPSVAQFHILIDYLKIENIELNDKELIYVLS